MAIRIIDVGPAALPTRSARVINPLGAGRAQASEGREWVAPTLPGPQRAKSVGRPLEKDRHNSIEQRKPWIAMGMGRSTWFRRKAKGELS